jgi:hypothetical protein
MIRSDLKSPPTSPHFPGFPSTLVAASSGPHVAVAAEAELTGREMTAAVWKDGGGLYEWELWTADARGPPRWALEDARAWLARADTVFEHAHEELPPPRVQELLAVRSQVGDGPARPGHHSHDSVALRGALAPVGARCATGARDGRAPVGG